MEDANPKTSLTAQIIDGLREAIVMADYAPREKLKIGDLAERFEASTGIVREALSRLCAEGLVIALPQRGFSVAPISRSDLEELTDARVEIERRCLAGSIARGDLSWEADLMAVHHRLKGLTLKALDSRDPDAVRAWRQVHNEFHDALTRACGNRWWLQIRSQLFTQSERYRQLSGLVRDADRDIAAEHEAIAHAALARDVDVACDLIEAHIRRTTALLLASPRFVQYTV